MAVEKFDVLRQHLGDRMYMPGDIREVNEGDVTHLVRNGVIKRKSELPTKNKAERSPQNKGD